MAMASESANNNTSSGKEQEQDIEYNYDVEKDEQGGDKNARGQEKKNFFQAELDRLRNNAREELKKPVYKEPERKGFKPYVHNQLGSYLETSGASFLIERVEVEGLPNTPSRYTATKLHDPWYDHRMDSPRVIEGAAEPGTASGSGSGGATTQKTPRQQGERKKAGEKGKEDPHAGDRKAGSTHLPPFPRVNIDYSEYVNRELSFADVDTLRRDARDKYQLGNRQKLDADYKRTRDDFYRMELDRLDQVSKGNRGNLCDSYIAYLRNTPGSSKAARECVKEAQQRMEKKKGKKGKRAGAKRADGEGARGQEGAGQQEGEGRAEGKAREGEGHDETDTDRRPPADGEGEPADAKHSEDSPAK